MSRVPFVVWLAVTALAQEPTGSVIVHVVDALTGKPVERAEVQVVDNEPALIDKRRDPAEAVWTDGKFLASNVPFGRYTVTVSRPERRPKFVGIEIESAKVPVEVTVKLPPTGTIIGVVRDEDGTPVEGVSIAANGPDLEYAHCVSGPGGAFAMEDATVGEVLLRLSMWDKAVSKSARVDTSSGRRIGYPRIFYYPGVEQHKAATLIAVAAGKVTRADVRVPRVPLVEVSGRVLNATTRMPLAVEVRLEANHDSIAGPQRVDEEGRFSFPNARPGPHAIKIHGVDGPLAHTVEVEAGPNGATGLEILTAPTVTIRGRMSAPGSFHLSNEPHSAMVVETKPDGSFEIRGVQQGKLHIDGVRPANGGYAQRVRVNGAEIPESAPKGAAFDFTVGPTGAGIEIEIVRGVGAISGNVTDARGGAARQVRVTAVSDETSHDTLTNDQGEFRFERLPMGDYRVFACNGMRERLRVEPDATVTSPPLLCR